MSEVYASEIHKLLKLGDPTLTHFNGAPEGLPVPGSAVHADKTDKASEPHNFQNEVLARKTARKIWTSVAKTKALLIYPVIFFAAFGVFYLLLN